MKEEALTKAGVPVLLALLVCDVAVADPRSGKKNLIGIFDAIDARQFPTQRQMSLYLKLGEAAGPCKIEARYVQVPSGTILAKADRAFSFPQKPSSVDKRQFEIFVPRLTRTLRGHAFPEKMLLGTLRDRRFRVISPIRIRLSGDRKQYVAEAPEFEEFGVGETFSEALGDLQRTLVELYLTLESERDRLGGDLPQLLGRLREKIQLHVL